MYAAVVNSFDAPPAYQERPAPVAGSSDEVLVDVLAAGLHPLVRSRASGAHYSSTDELPLIPGVDGVGRLPDGELRYFVLPDTTAGSMAEQTVIDRRRSMPLAPGTDPVLIAAAMNPAMSSWVALRRRISFQAGHSVLVLGATGNAGRLAAQVARKLGADRVVAAGRDQQQLSDLAEQDHAQVVSLGGDPAAARHELGRLAGDVDVVLDYLWGQPAADAIRTVITQRPDRSKPLSWVQIGSVAGADAPVPSAALRAAQLQIVGSGLGSVPIPAMLAELGELATEITAGSFRIDPRPVPLSDVGAVWQDTSSQRRIVLVP